MSLKLKDIVGNIFYTDRKEKAAEEKRTTELQQKANNTFGNSGISTLNPFLDKNGNLLNNGLNYQHILNSPNVSQRVKNFIAEATGLASAATQSKAKSTATPVPYDPSKGTTSATVTSDSATPSNNSGTTTLPKESTATPVSKSGNAVVNAAQKYMGTPYVWGGESMSEGGMDCSGFVYNALKDSGHNVGRTTAEGYRQGGTSVSKDNLKPGDLVFYGSGKATHIAIYAGDGKIIHSSGSDKNTKSNPGKGVTVTNIDYRNDYLGAKRY